MKVKLISWTKNPIETIAEAASMCYKSKPSPEIVKGCIRSMHMSVVEHANFTFKIENVDRALSHQFVRHRIASYSQESQRYVSMEDSEFIVPTTFDETKTSVFNSCAAKIRDTYSELLELGAEKEDARSILPNACETSFVVTMNLRTLSNFMNERLCTRAQLPIRKLAVAMKKAVLDCEDIDEKGRKIIEMLLVPKCEKSSIKACPEIKGCEKHPYLKDIIKEEFLS